MLRQLSKLEPLPQKSDNIRNENPQPMDSRKLRKDIELEDGLPMIDVKRLTRALRSRTPCVNRSSGSKVIAIGSWCERRKN
ncbi:hypothetical protein PIB30_032994 [Stylosanthes scabra]|uniref:Uncharacterized protein n=1 Tax=Stylosanthes scabra TaxID=79078 RepID=A0ABU6TC35_9FABA|nr:hypothetical protein [Stylosanthes scabra]